MRTTIRMNDALRRQAQELAKAEGRTFTSVVEEAVTRLLAERRTPRPRKRIVLPTFSGGKPMSDAEFKAAVEEMDLEDDLKRIGKARG
jgi:hypothetical protein